jgi:hypothetical protein
VSRAFFDLGYGHLASDVTGLVLAACAGTALTVFLALTHRLPGTESPRPEH